MPPPPTPITLPTSYPSLPFKEIKLSHHPESSSTVTPIIIVTLYRPKQHNAFTDQMMQEIEVAFKYFSVDDRVKCIVLTGHGRMFCAGADLVVGLGIDNETEREHRDGGGRASLAIHQCPKPTIAAIQGPAVGVGITMVLPATIRVALRSAKIGFVFGRRGIAMEGASSYFLPRLIGYGRAVHIVSTGSVYRADDRLLDGLFTEFGDSAEEVVQKALGLAEDMVQNVSTVSTYLQREMIWRGCDSAEATHLLDSRILAGLRGKADNDEGVKSFMEKRPAKFTGTLENCAPQVFPWWTPVDITSKQKTTGPPPTKLKL